jgi:hypothetical protein
MFFYFIFIRVHVDLIIERQIFISVYWKKLSFKMHITGRT